MKNRIALGLTIVFILMSITACSTNKGTTEKEQADFSDKSIANNGMKIEADEGLEILTNPAEFTRVTENQEYNFETDCQNEFSELLGSYNDCVETKDSYIFLRDEHLFAFNKFTRKYYILCDNPSCSHDYVESCNAYINGAQGIEYYNGNLYALVNDKKIDESGVVMYTLELYKMSLNGRDRERVCEVAAALDIEGRETNVFTVWCAFIHRGYLYYMYSYGVGETEDSYYVNHSNTLYRIALTADSEPECICPMKYVENTGLLEYSCNGSYVYFIRREELGYDSGGYLYRLNTESMKLEYMDAGVIWGGYTIIGNEIIYIKEEGTYYAYNMDTGKNYEFIKPESVEGLEHGYTMYDGRYFYILLYNIETHKRYWEVYTLQKTKIDQYECSEIMLEKDTGTYFIDHLSAGSDFDFMVATDGSELMYLDKNQLGNGTAEFVLAE